MVFDVFNLLWLTLTRPPPQAVYIHWGGPKAPHIADTASDFYLWRDWAISRSAALFLSHHSGARDTRDRHYIYHHPGPQSLSAAQLTPQTGLPFGGANWWGGAHQLQVLLMN